MHEPGPHLGGPRDPIGGQESDPENEERFGAPIDTHRIARRLFIGRKWIAGALLLGAVISLPLAKWGLASTYKATAMLEYEGTPRLEGLPQVTDQNVGGMLQAVYVNAVLAQIHEAMGYDMPTADVGRLLHAHADEAGVARIEASEKTPEGAARLANTAAEAFTAHRVEAERIRIDQAIGALRRRIAAANTALGRAQRTYDDFRQEQGIADLSTEQEQAIENAAELRAARDRAESEVAGLEARLEQIRTDLRRTPQTRTTTSSAGGSSPERTELGRLEAELTRARGNLADSHPRVQALQQQIATLRERIASGQATEPRTTSTSTNAQWTNLQTSASTAEADLEAARHRLEGLVTQAARAQERVEQFSSIEGDASRLLAEVRVNQQLLTELQATQARLEDARRHPASGFRVISEATEPDYAERSKAKYVVAAAIPLGLLLVVLLALLGRELRGFRVRTAKELAFWGRGPVIGSSTWPRDPQAIDELIADMDDFIPDASGQMLAIGANENFNELAATFAARLNSDWYDTTLIGAPLFEEDDPRLSLPPGDDDLPGAGSMPSPKDTVRNLPPHMVEKAAALALAPKGGIDKAHHAHAHHLLDTESPMQMRVEAWEGRDHGPALRRAARLADRVCVIVPAGQLSFLEVQQITTRLGRRNGVGFILADVAPPYASLIDRVGPVDRFWASQRD